MAEHFRLQRVRAFYPLAGPGPFISTSPSDISFGGLRRPNTGGFHVSSVKTHERTGTHPSKRISTAVEPSRRRHSRESTRPFEISLPDTTGDRPLFKYPPCKGPNETTRTSPVEDSVCESPVAVELEIARPKRMITVVLPSLKMTDDDEDPVAMDTCKCHDAARDSLLGSGVRTRQILPGGQSKDDHGSVAADGNHPTPLDQSDRKKSATPVYRIRYVHFDKNRAAVGHARQIANRLYAINLQRQSSALNRIELT